MEGGRESMEERVQTVAVPAAAQGGARSEETKKMKVLVAVDESDGSLYALSWVLDNLFARPSAAAAADTAPDLVLLHAQQPLQHFMHPVGPSVYATPLVVDSVKKAQEQNSLNLLQRAHQVCSSKLVAAETAIVDGDPKVVICNFAEEMHADLLVVGSRGLSKIKRAFLGSVSDYCAHHAKCPVLIVKWK